MDNILKGNFKVKRPIKTTESHSLDKHSLPEELRKRALASLGGSMVYMERNRLIWDGDK